MSAKRIHERFMDAYVDQPEGRLKFVDQTTPIRIRRRRAAAWWRAVILDKARRSRFPVPAPCRWTVRRRAVAPISASR